MTAVSIHSALASFSSQGPSGNCCAGTLIQIITHVQAERFCPTVNCVYIFLQVRILCISSSGVIADK